MRPVEFPPIEAVLPHEGPTVFLTRVLEHDLAHTVCEVDLRPETLMAEREGCVPAWVGVEYMAQCVAAHAGLVEHAAGRKPRPGFLVGSRAIALHTDAFRPGQTLAVRAHHRWGVREGMVSFDCSIRDTRTDTTLVEGRLNCFLPPKGVAGAAGSTGELR